MSNCRSKEDRFFTVNLPNHAAQKKAVVRQLKMATCSGLSMLSFPHTAIMKSTMYGIAPFLPGCQWCKFLHHFEDGAYLLAGDILAGVGVEVVINYEVNPRIGLCTRMILTGMISVLW